MKSEFCRVPLIRNKVAHDVKADVCRIGGTEDHKNGHSEESAHIGMSRHGGTQSTKHAS